MDEPFAALDAITRDVLHDELTRIWAEQGLSVVFVTHNVREAVRLGQRVVLLSLAARAGSSASGGSTCRSRGRIESPGGGAAVRRDHRATCERRSAAMAAMTPAGPPSRAEPAATRRPRDARGRARRARDAVAAPPRPAAGRRGRSVCRRCCRPRRCCSSVWQLAYLAEVKPPTRCRSPADVVRRVWTTMPATAGAWRGDLGPASRRGALGFALSRGHRHAARAWRMWRSRWLRAAIGPIVSGLQSLPSVAWVPAAIIWFGLSDAAIYAVMLLGAVPSIANGLLAGIDQVPPLFAAGRPGARRCRRWAGSGTCCCRPRCPGYLARPASRAGRSPGAR